ncbi:HEAT repeat domain-containing protein [Glycomyces buryatensis]|uniref:HEAT repeat domain-containing protein n=1 Tax=Glycomyces buryatensis TaxID=2570927 RepID=A0A4S8PZF5_9ACTN|nr:HEAT repeat domain-containing protein [Glycomyces buryatensis]THV37088.1 HEAT repeat domain-containing protein [Glycomyces buryatensis]
MFNGLNDIDWSALQHAYGSAQEVPALLVSLRSEDPAVRRRALDECYSTVHHQGSVYDSTVAALPFLVDVAEDPGTGDRSAVVRLLVSIGESAVEQAGRGYGSDTDAGAQAVAVLRERAAVFERFASDSDPGLREAAVGAFAWCMEDAVAAGAFLRARFGEDADVQVRLAIVAAMAGLAARSETMGIAAWEWFGSVAHKGAAHPVLRFSALAYSAQVAPDRIDDGLVERGVGFLAEVRVAPVEPAAATSQSANGGVPPEVVAAFADMDRAVAETTVVTKLLGVLHGALGDRLADRAVLIRAQLSHVDDAVRLDGIRDAQGLITAWRGDHAALVDALADLLHGIGPVPARAAGALGACAPVAGAAADGLGTYVASLAGEPLAAAWHVADDELREPFQEAVLALAKLGDVRAVPYLVEALDSGVDTWKGVQVAGGLSEATGVLAPRIAAYLASLNPGSRRDTMRVNAALSALGKLGDPGTIGPIMDALTAATATNSGNDVPTAAPAALNALAALGPAAGPAADAVWALTGSANLHIQAAAVKAWWRISGDQDATVKLALNLLDASAWFAINDGASLLTEFGPDAAAALPRLRELMGHSYEWVRVSAAAAVWAIGGETETEAVLGVLLAAWNRNAVTGRVVAPLLDRMGDDARLALERIRAELANNHRGDVASLRDDEMVLGHCRAVADRFTDG